MAEERLAWTSKQQILMINICKVITALTRRSMLCKLKPFSKLSTLALQLPLARRSYPSTQPLCHDQCQAHIGRSDCCNHGVQQMDERSPVGCWLFYCVCPSRCITFGVFIQMFISAQKQMPFLIHKHLSLANYPSAHTSSTHIGHIRAHTHTVIQNSSRKTKAESQLAVSSLRKLLFQ